MNRSRLVRPSDRRARRREGRRPLLEDLEARRLPSGIAVNPIGTPGVAPAQVEPPGPPPARGAQAGSGGAHAAILFPVFAR